MAEIRGSRCLGYPTDEGQTINFIYSFKEFPDHRMWALTSKGVYSFQTDHWQKVRLYPGFDNHGYIDIIDSENGMMINYGHELVLKKKDGNLSNKRSLISYRMNWQQAVFLYISLDN